MTSIMKASKFIPAKYIALLATSLDRGETECFVHDGCLGGESTKRKLYITRKQDNTLLAYCHRCGMRGFVRDPNHVTNIHTDTTKRHEVLGDTQHWLNQAGVLRASSSISDVMRTPNGAKPLNRWLESKHVDPVFAEKDGLLAGYTRGGHFWTIMYPCYASGLDKDDTLDEPRLTGLQVRYFIEDYQMWPEGHPKVKTFGHAGPHLVNPNDSPVLYIVEDRISGIRIAQAGGAALVLHGCYVPRAEDAHACACMFDRVVVWLDNDNPKVVETAVQIQKVFSMFTDAVFVHASQEEPKNTEPVLLAATVRVDLGGVESLGTSIKVKE